MKIWKTLSKYIDQENLVICPKNEYYQCDSFPNFIPYFFVDLTLNEAQCRSVLDILNVVALCHSGCANRVF